MCKWVITVLLIGAITVSAQNDTAAEDQLMVTSVMVEPYLTKKDGSYEGYLVDLLNEVMTRINKKFEIQIAADGLFGAKQDDGTWTGMIGEVMEGDANIIAAPLTVTLAREEVLDFGKPFLNTGLLGVTSQPQPEIKPDFFLVFKPFSVGVWFLVLVCFVVFSLLLFVINQFHPSEWRQAFSRGKGSEDNVKAFGVQGSLWMAFSTLALQGYEKTPRSLAGRILMAFWFFFVIFTVALYISSMVNTLAAANQDPVVRPVPQDLTQHVEDGGKVVVLKGGYAESFFKSSSIPDYQEIASSLVPVSSMSAGLSQVRSSNGQLALVTDSPTVQYAILREPCDLKTVGGMLNSGAFAFAFAKGSDLKDPIDDVLLQLRSDGELARLQNKWWNDRKECETPSPDSNTPVPPVRPIVARPVSLNNFSGGIIIFMLGILLSSLVAVVEYAYRAQKSKPRKTKEQLLEAEEGQALNETVKTVLDKTAVEDENEKEMQEIKKKEDDTGPELEPEDKEKTEEKDEDKPDGADNKTEDATDKIVELKS